MALRPCVFGNDDHFFGMAVRRIQAAILCDPRLSNAEVRVFEKGSVPLREWTQELLDFEPDVFAASAYVWSLPTFVLLAHAVRERFPNCLTVFGGPSARPAVFGLPPYRPYQRDIDALVLGEGEAAICEIVVQGLEDKSRLSKVPGLALPSPLGWRQTPKPAQPLNLNELPSAYQMGLFPKNSMAWLETYRGCPMTCSFCQWGFVDPSQAVLTEDYLVREFEAMAAIDPPMVAMLDVGLNLNARAFRNLARAEAQTGFLKGRVFNTEMFPTLVRDEHLEFLANARSEVGLGLQSADPAVLEGVERPFKRDKFAKIVEDLASVALVWAEIIIGLPGDSPEGVRDTIAFLRDLPCNVRIYHCLVLPDGLMTRHPQASEIRFHPITLELESAPGWSARELGAMSEWLGEVAESDSTQRQRHLTGDGDRLEEYVEHLAHAPGWEIVRSRLPPGHDAPQVSADASAQDAPAQTLDVQSPAFRKVNAALNKFTGGRVRAAAMRVADSAIEIDVEVEGQPHELIASPQRAGDDGFLTVRGYTFVFRSDAGTTLDTKTTTLLELTINVVARCLPKRRAAAPQASATAVR